MNVAGLVVAGGEGVGWIVRTESKGLSKAVGGHGVLEVGSREEVEAKRWCIKVKVGREEHGNERGIWEKMVGRGDG